MKHKKRKKWLTVLLIAAALLAAAGGVWYFTTQRTGEAVAVYPFSYLGMTEYWGDNKESYGPVTTDKIQTVFLSETQSVTEIYVRQGDSVKQGDLLMCLDTTLSDLAVERKRLEVEKVRLQLLDAQERLQQIRNMRPMVVPTVSPEAPEDDESLGPLLDVPYLVSSQMEYDGSSRDKALICWLRTDKAIDDDILEALRRMAEVYQTVNAEQEQENPREEGGEQPPAGEEGGETPPVGEGGETPPSEEGGETPPDGEGGEEPAQPLSVDHFYVVVKVTQGNRAFAQKVTWQGLSVTRQGSGEFRFQLFSPGSLPDHMLQDLEGEEEETPEVDLGSGYTAAQLAQMRAEQEKKIKELELSVRMAEADYKLMLLEVSDGNVYAKFDGMIMSVLSDEEARELGQPVLKLFGGGGFYVEAAVSELERENLTIGQEVTVDDWNTGMTYMGTVVSVGDLPSSENYYDGMSNPNVSYYPFRVFVDGSADLQEGRYVSVRYAASNASNGIYLQNPFLRTEQGRSYVYLRGADGSLEKRYVVTGKSLWGSYTEILEGFTAEDFLAFPYGKTVKEGAPTVEGDMNSLYS